MTRRQEALRGLSVVVADEVAAVITTEDQTVGEHRSRPADGPLQSLFAGFVSVKLFESLGGNLVTVNSEQENAWVYNQWASGRNLWIGLNDVESEGTFVWISGEDAPFRYWRQREPNGGVGDAGG